MWRSASELRKPAVSIGLAVAAAVAAASSFAAAPKPVITSVTLSGSVAAPAFVLHGHGFGSRPAASGPPSSSSACRGENAPGNEGRNFGSKLFFIDLGNKFSGGLSGPYRGTPNVVDCVGLIVKSYSPSRIVYTLGSDYRKHPYAVRTGDKVLFVVNGARATLAVKYGAAVANPSG